MQKLDLKSADPDFRLEYCDQELQMLLPDATLGVLQDVTLQTLVEKSLHAPGDDQYK